MSYGTVRIGWITDESTEEVLATQIQRPRPKLTRAVYVIHIQYVTCSVLPKSSRRTSRTSESNASYIICFRLLIGELCQAHNFEQDEHQTKIITRRHVYGID